MIANTLRTNLVIQVITLVTSIMMARLLGPTGRGELALVLLYPQLVANIALFGVDRAIAVMAGRNELVNPVRVISMMVLLVLLPAIGIAWITIEWRISDKHLVALAHLYVLYIPAMHFFVLAVAMFNGMGDFGRFNRARLGFYLLNALLVAALWANVPLPLSLPVLDWVLYANLAAVFGVLSYCFWLLRDFESMARRSTDEPICRTLGSVISLAILYAFPLALAQFNSLAYQIFVEHWMGVKALGVFVVLITFSRLLSPIGGAVSSHLFRLGIAGGHPDIARIFRLCLIVYLCMSVLLWLTSSWAIPLIFGRDFIVDVKVVGLILISTTFSMLSDSLAEFLHGQRKVFSDLIGRFLYITILTLFSWILIPSFGLVAIAFAMALSDLTRYIWLVWQISISIDCPTSCFIFFRKSDATELVAISRKIIGNVLIRK